MPRFFCLRSYYHSNIHPHLTSFSHISFIWKQKLVPEIFIHSSPDAYICVLSFISFIHSFIKAHNSQQLHLHVRRELKWKCIRHDNWRWINKTNNQPSPACMMGEKKSIFCRERNWQKNRKKFFFLLISNLHIVCWMLVFFIIVPTSI